MAEKSNEWALITGATSGIGRETAKVFAKAGYSLWILGRRRERLEELKITLEETFGAEVLTASIDIQDLNQMKEWVDLEKEKLAKVRILVNNAGLARGVDPVQESIEADWEEMINTNFKGLVHLTRLLLPFMVKKQCGHIVNVGSVAGRWVYPGGAIYCATKHAVRAFSEGLRMDLAGLPIRVSTIEPGMAETEFSEVRLRSKEEAAKVYANMEPLSGQDVAQTILWMVERPPHVNVQELVLFPTEQAAVGLVARKQLFKL